MQGRLVCVCGWYGSCRVVAVANHEGAAAVRHTLQEVPFMEGIPGTEGDAVFVSPDDFKIFPVYVFDAG